MALFYSPALARGDLQSLALGIAEAVADRIEFSGDTGGEEPRELGIPLLPGADEVEVTEAGIVMSALPLDREVTFQAENAPGSTGVVVTLPGPAHLRKLEISYTEPLLTVPFTLHTVVRGASKEGAGFEFSPPLFANPAFPPPGPMYGEVFAGLSVTNMNGGHRLLTLQGLLGTSWLVQLAQATSPTDLAPLAIAPGVHRLVIAAAPSNLRVIMETEEGDVPLWANPAMLLPDAGQQVISFVALAQRQLSALLKKAAPSDLALSVSLRFASGTPGAIGIHSTTLSARYKVFPLGSEPTVATIGGDLTPLSFLAPGGVEPDSSSIRLTVRLAGRELNAGSPEPPLSRPSSGLRAAVDTLVAASVPFLPLAGDPPGSVLPLASVRLYLAAMATSEAALEIRNDLGGKPGDPVTSPMVLSIEKGDSGWFEFLPPSPLPASAGQAPLWITLRVNRGEVLWYTAGEGTPEERISTDKGSTWSQPERPLRNSGTLLVQLYHALQDPLPPPVVRIQHGATVLADNLCSSTERRGPREFAVPARSLPPALHILLGSQMQTGKASTDIQLFSRSVGDITIEQAALFYDPFRAAARVLGTV